MNDLLDNLSYEDAKKELDAILLRLEGGEVNIDKLEELVNRAKALVKYCQERLKTIEERLAT